MAHRALGEQTAAERDFHNANSIDPEIDADVGPWWERFQQRLDERRKSPPELEPYITFDFDDLPKK
jgi:hypothetical protein